MRALERGEPLMKEAEKEGLGDRISLVELDVTDTGSIEAGITAILEKTGGRLDALLNNAGYSILGAFEDLSDADWRKQMDTNFFGALSVTRAVLPAMREAGKGRIVIVSSNAVNTPHPMLSLYAASKWALEGWAEGLAMEVAPFGIDVAIVQPGAHRTPFAQHVVPVMPEDSPYRQWMEAAMPGVQNLDRWGRDPALATGPIVSAVADPSPPFRRPVGEDSEAFSLLKGLFPYEVRAWAARAIAGLPGPGAFAKQAPQPAGASAATEILERIFADPQAAHTALATIFGKESQPR
jgi:NAD(P)-dependent dehydrogenase (short-subunit alcohol dehydrogenase family)